MKFLVVSALVLLASSASASEPLCVNKIVGNSGYETRYGRAPDRATTEQDLIVSHLAYVYELLASTNPDLSPQLSSARTRNLGRLRDYIDTGLFPVNSQLSERSPVFVDEYGTRCAVAHLYELDRGTDATLQAAARFRHALIEEINFEDLAHWQVQSGLSVRELAMIQPTYAPRRPGVPNHLRVVLEDSQRLVVGRTESRGPTDFEVDWAGGNFWGRDVLDAHEATSAQHEYLLRYMLDQSNHQVKRQPMLWTRADYHDEHLHYALEFQGAEVVTGVLCIWCEEWVLVRMLDRGHKVVPYEVRGQFIEGRGDVLESVISGWFANDGSELSVR